MKYALRNIAAMFGAAILFILLTPVSLAVRAVQGGVLRYVMEAALFTALAIDWAGNVVGAPLFNLALIKPGAYQFGQMANPYEPETISKVLAVNRETGTLTGAGKLLGRTLDFLDRNHLDKALGKP